MRYGCMKTGVTASTKYSGQHTSEVSILLLQTEWRKDLKGRDNDNWQNIVIHVVCIPKCLEFSANLCIYSKLWPENCGWKVSPWNWMGGLPLRPWALSSVKKGWWDRAMRHNKGYREGCSRILCALHHTMWTRRKEVAGDWKWIKRNTYFLILCKDWY